jgi:hypothetical protein
MHKRTFQTGTIWGKGQTSLNRGTPNGTPALCTMLILGFSGTMLLQSVTSEPGKRTEQGGTRPESGRMPDPTQKI